jgi:hypothetical protein
MHLFYNIQLRWLASYRVVMGMIVGLVVIPAKAKEPINIVLSPWPGLRPVS